MSDRPIFFFDICSPYAYLAASRVPRLLPDAEWRPVLLGGLHKAAGRHSWLYDDDREERMAEIEHRALTYGLPPIRWWTSLPTSWLTVMRAVTVAASRGRAVQFSLAAFRAAHAEGRELWHDAELALLAPAAGLGPDELLEAARDDRTKRALRAATEEAAARGVIGVPTLAVGDELFWGDDRLEEAVTAASATTA